MEVLMKRWHQDYQKSFKEWKKHRKDHIENNKNRMKYPGYDPNVVDCSCDEQVGRFRKKKGLDCGNPRCGICHKDKFPKRTPTDQEEISRLGFKEQLKDF
jgi:hypothetical protein